MQLGHREKVFVVRTSGGKWLAAFRRDGFVGVDFQIHQDLSWVSESNDDWARLRELVKRFCPPTNANTNVERSAGVLAGALWMFLHGLVRGSVVMIPLPGGDWLVGRVTGDYHFVAGDVPEHRRAVRWVGQLRADQISKRTFPVLTSWSAVFGVTADSQKVGAYDDLSDLIRTLPEPEPGPKKSEAPVLDRREIVYRKLDQVLQLIEEIRRDVDGLSVA